MNRIVLNITTWVFEAVRIIIVITQMIVIYKLLFGSGSHMIQLFLGTQFDFIQQPEVSIFKPHIANQLNEVNIYPTGYRLLLPANEDLRLMALLSNIFIMVVSFFMATMIIRVLRSISAGEFFNKRNVNSMRWLGLLVLLLKPSEQLLTYVSDRYFDSILSTYKVYGGITFQEVTVDLLWSSSTAGVLILILAQVFAYGLELKNEEELTI